MIFFEEIKTWLNHCNSSTKRLVVRVFSVRGGCGGAAGRRRARVGEVAGGRRAKVRAGRGIKEPKFSRDGA
jgi:hypothetical protein